MIRTGLLLTCILSLPFSSTGIALAQETKEAATNLLQAREGFETKLTKKVSEAERLAEPPSDLFSIVEYDTELGPMSAYLSKPDDETRKHAAIIWLTGGFPAGRAGRGIWEPAPYENDPSAAAYRNAGMIMMYPALRGTAGNPGAQESFFGEVDDVLAAADFLRKRDDVDRNSIYLGGHGTGATLAMLVAASTDRFRAVFAFAPVDDPNVYGRESLTYDPSDEKERRLRAPLLYASSIRKPTFVIDGSHDHESFMNSFRSVENPKLFCYTVIGANHYSILSPSNRLIASKISSLDGSSKGGLSEDELNQAFEDGFHANRQARDLEMLARLRREGVNLAKSHRVRHVVRAKQRLSLETFTTKYLPEGVDAESIREVTDKDGNRRFETAYSMDVRLDDLKAVFAASRIGGLSPLFNIKHQSWDLQ